MNRRTFLSMLGAFFLGVSAFLFSQAQPELDVESLRVDYQPQRRLALEATIDYLHSLFLTKYAPVRWKDRYLGWNPTLQTQLAKNQLRALQSLDLDAIKPLFNRLISSAQDGHVSLQYIDKRALLLPLGASLVDDKIIITYSAIAGIEPGDELLRVGGKPVLEYISEHLYGASPQEAPLYRPSRNLWRLFARSGQTDAIGDPDQPLEITVSRGGFFQITLQAAWTYIPNINWFFPGNDDDDLLDPRDEPKEVVQISHELRRFAHLDPQKKLKSSLQRLSLEALGAHHAYKLRSYTKPYTDIYDVYGKKIGYFRLPDFTDEKAIEVLDEALESFNDQTLALVIDLRDNLGGYDFLCYGLLSRLSDKPLLNLTESYILDESLIHSLRKQASLYEKALEKCENEQDIQDCFGKEVLGYTITSEMIKGLILHYKSQVEEWELGQTCTRFVPSLGLNYLEPHPQLNYTKPIYLLVNECSGSCGDIFPAILKDNHRATILGRTTAGAGGCVKSYSFPNFTGIAQLSLTSSLMLRNNQLVIENLGITPDYETKLTPELAIYPFLELRQAMQWVASQLEEKQEN